MGSQPSAWGTGANAVHPSLTRGDKVPTPLRDVSPVSESPLSDNDSKTETAATGASYEAENREVVEFYTVTSGKTAGEDPSGWVLKGSVDGRRWKVLDERRGEKFSWRQQTRPFKVDDPGRYTRYRLEFTGEARAAEVEFLAKPARR